MSNYFCVALFPVILWMYIWQIHVVKLIISSSPLGPC